MNRAGKSTYCNAAAANAGAPLQPPRGGLDARGAAGAGLAYALLLLPIAGSAWATEPSPTVIGRPIAAARALLLAAGWAPRETQLRDTGGTELHSQGPASVLFGAGLREVESCRGTRTTSCAFNYVRQGRCLRLTTRGEQDPLVVRQTPACPPANSAGARTLGSGAK